MKNRFTPPRPHGSESLVHGLHSLAEDLFQEIRRSRAAEKYKRPVLPKVIQFALMLLRKGPGGVVAADKDGCFVSVDTEELDKVHLGLMRRPEYRFLPRSLTSKRCGKTIQRCQVVCYSVLRNSASGP